MIALYLLSPERRRGALRSVVLLLGATLFYLAVRWVLEW
jgi:hypothetical protein